MPTSQVRVVGGGNTYCQLAFNGGEINVEFLAQLSDTPPRGVTNPVEIQGIGDKRPVEIVTPYAQSAGQITLSVWQQWGKDGWVSAMATTNTETGTTDLGFWNNYITAGRGNGSNGYPIDLVEIWDAQRLNPDNIVVKQVELKADGSIARTKTYHGCVITGISDSSLNFENKSMDNKVQITMMYTHYTIDYA